MFNSARSRFKTWVTAGAGTIAAVLVAGLMGAFGSLHKPPAILVPGKQIETGQWLVRPFRAYAAGNRVYGLPLKPGDKALVFEVELTNRTAQSSKDYFTIFQPVRPVGNPDNKPFIVLTRDSTLSPELHPGMPERMAYIWSVPENGPMPQELALDVSTQTYKKQDNFYGLPGWLNPVSAGTLTLPVGAGPDTPDAQP